MNYLIGADIGTSGVKSILMDTGGNLIASRLEEYDLLTPRALWAEQWPDVWVEGLIESMRRTVEDSGVAAADVKGICVSGLYGGSGIPLDEDMKPVRPCLIWMDRRAKAQQEWVLEHIGAERIERITHNGTDPYYGYTKILWIRDNEPENWAKTRLFLPPNAYAIYRLTGEVAIDYSSAGNIGGIFDMNRRTWSHELMDEMGIPRDMMPRRIVESSDIVGGLTPEMAQKIGLAAGTPVCAGGVDCVVATLGMGVYEPGVYAAAIGTSMCAALVHDRPLDARGFISMPYVKDAKTHDYSFGGAATAGAITKWFRDNLAIHEKLAEQQGGPNAYKALDDGAAKIAPGSEGIVVLPYFMGERSPLWDTNARGTVVGLSLHHTHFHLFRAFMESVAYALRHSIESTHTDLGEYIIVAGGVAKSDLWLQIIADVTGYAIRSPLNDVEANLGDVILAGVGTGVLTYEEAQKWQRFRPEIRPNPETKRIYDQYYTVYRKIYQNLKQDYTDLAALH